MSGYLDFERTGVDAFDAVLEAIENAGSAYHHTSEWAEGGFMHDETEKTQLELINEKIAEVRALIANSPQIDGMVLVTQVLCALLSNPARYEHIRQQVESGELTQEQATQKNINKAMLIADSMLSAYKPQVDDVRKDAEREWVPKFPVGSKVVFYQKHPESPLNKAPTFGTVESYYDWNTAECGEHYTIKMAVVDVDGVKIKVEHNCLLSIDKARE